MEAVLLGGSARNNKVVWFFAPTTLENEEPDPQGRGTIHGLSDHRELDDDEYCTLLQQRGLGEPPGVSLLDQGSAEL